MVARRSSAGEKAIDVTGWATRKQSTSLEGKNRYQKNARRRVTETMFTLFYTIIISQPGDSLIAYPTCHLAGDC